MQMDQIFQVKANLDKNNKIQVNAIQYAKCYIRGGQRQVESKMMENVLIYVNTNHKSTGLAISVSQKVDFQTTYTN